MRFPTIALLLIAAPPVFAQHAGHGSAEAVVNAPVLGEINFPTAASKASHDAFVRGVLLMHNFHYTEAATAFQNAQWLDPTNVMGYWGEAMTYTHPVWDEQDTAAATRALQSSARDSA